MVIKLTGERELQRKLLNVSKRIANTQKMYKVIGVFELKEIDRTFAKETHEGKPWKAHSPDTIEQRRTGKKSGVSGITGQVFGIKKLQDTGTLKNSFNARATKHQVVIGAAAGKQNKKTGVFVGQYAVNHEEGNRALGIPQRKMLPSKGRGLEIAVDVAEEYVRQAVKGSGLF